MKKSGKYDKNGETYSNECDSRDALSEVYEWLLVTHQIDGWSFKILNSGMPESMYMDRDGIEYDKEHVTVIKTDVPCIILQNDDNNCDWFLVLSGEDKYQESKGNAIERFATNYNAIKDKVCNNSDICPYVLFACGVFINDCGEPDEYLKSRFRKAIPYGWKLENPHTSYKRDWNCVYFKKDRFSECEKIDILKAIAKQSVTYLKSRLEYVK